MKVEHYHSITKGNKKWLIEEVYKKKISILSGFINNVDLVEDFYESYYSKNKSRIVLCRINP